MDGKGRVRFILTQPTINKLLPLAIPAKAVRYLLFKM